MEAEQEKKYTKSIILTEKTHHLLSKRKEEVEKDFGDLSFDEFLKLLNNCISHKKLNKLIDEAKKLKEKYKEKIYGEETEVK